MVERKITIGTDPEYFLKNIKTNALVSAIPFIKGDKENPTPLPSGGNIQSDNVAVEFSTKPAETTQDFINNIRATLSDTINVLPKEFELAVLPSAEFPKEELKDPKACEFGCESDYCAWDLIENNPPIPPSAEFRSCGGHIHIGCLTETGKLTHKDAEFLLDHMGKVAMVRGMDIFHGFISTILDNSKEAIKRRKLYGKAGCHRPTDYGVEYRTLSNYWTKTPYSSMLMSSLADDVIEVIVAGKLDELIEEIGEEDIKRIINDGNVADAKSALEKYISPYMNDESKFYLEECLTKLDKDTDLVKAWEIGK